MFYIMICMWVFSIYFLMSDDFVLSGVEFKLGDVVIKRLDSVLLSRVRETIGWI